MSRVVTRSYGTALVVHFPAGSTRFTSSSLPWLTRAEVDMRPISARSARLRGTRCRRAVVDNARSVAWIQVGPSGCSSRPGGRRCRSRRLETRSARDSWTSPGVSGHRSAPQRPWEEPIDGRLIPRPSSSSPSGSLAAIHGCSMRCSTGWHSITNSCPRSGCGTWPGGLPCPPAWSLPLSRGRGRGRPRTTRRRPGSRCPGQGASLQPRCPGFRPAAGSGLRSVRLRPSPAARTGKSHQPNPALPINLSFRLRHLFGPGGRSETMRVLLTYPVDHSTLPGSRTKQDSLRGTSATF